MFDQKLKSTFFVGHPVYIYTIFTTWLHFWLNIAINILFSAINWINIWFPLKSNMNFLLYFWNDIISVSSKYSQTVYVMNWHFHYDFFNKVYKIRPHSIIAFVSYLISLFEFGNFYKNHYYSELFAKLLIYSWSRRVSLKSKFIAQLRLVRLFSFETL